jgi:5-methylcytosine-specific restriction protein A
MNDLSGFCKGLRDRSGIDLEVLRPQGDPDDLRFRIKGFPRTYSFSFRMSRAWRSSRLIFEPDTFSQPAISSMVRKIVENREEVERLIENAESTLSTFMVRVDGREIDKIDTANDYSSSELKVSAEVFSEQSVQSLDYLTDSESRLVETVVEFVVYLLSASESHYVAAEEAEGFPEGAVETVIVNRYERDSRNRAIAIRENGLNCAVCAFNFAEFYGPLGIGFIVVHHVVPVSQLGPDYVINPTTDLVCICANCHAMVHRSNPPLSVSELRQQLEARSSSQQID